MSDGTTLELSPLVSLDFPKGSEADGPGTLVVDGFPVPNLTVSRTEENPQKWLVNLDRRFAVFATDEELALWGWLLAHAMAVGAGFTSHGPNSAVRNPHGPAVAGVFDARGEVRRTQFLEVDENGVEA